MNYFVSCLYGQYEKYRQILQCLQMKDKDKLWILGDVLDGNDKQPEQNLRLLDEIHDNPQVELLCGDHEYARVKRELAEEKEKVEWNKKISEFTVSGDAFEKYIRTRMTKDEKRHYFIKILLELNVTQALKIGNKNIYLVHGTPAKWKGDQSEWEEKVCFGKASVRKDVYSCVLSEPSMNMHLLEKDNVTRTNLITVSGQLSPERAAKEAGCKMPIEGAFFYNGMLAIGRDTVRTPIYVVGIDEFGFFIQGKYD